MKIFSRVLIGLLLIAVLVPVFAQPTTNFGKDPRFWSLVVPKYTVTTLTTASAQTYTVPAVLGGMLLRNTSGANRTDTLPTAALLQAAMPGVFVGSGVEFTIRNTAGAAETITVAAGTGGTTSGTMTIAQNNSKRFLLVFTAVGTTPTYTVYSLGTVVH